MFTKGKEKTLRTLQNFLKGVKEEKYAFLGARFDSPHMVSNTIPLASHVDDINISKEGVMEATIAFRPVGSQLKELETFRDVVEHLSLGEFLDTFTSEPYLKSDYRIDSVATESAISNIQEVLYRPYLTLPTVYVNTVTIARTKFYQVTVQDDGDGQKIGEQTLTMLFTEFAYHGQTLAGTFNALYLTRTESLKAMQFFVNGSLYSEIIGLVNVNSPYFATSLFPLFNDATCTLYKNEEGKGFLSITCDTGVTYIGEDDIKRIAFNRKGEGKVVVTIYLKDNLTKFELYLG